MTWSAILQSCDGLDRHLFHRLVPIRTSVLGRHWNRHISRLADGPTYVVLGLLPLLTGHAHRTAFPLAMAIGFALELPAYKLIKHKFKRPRPCDVLRGAENRMPIPDVYSFPSGHTAGAFVLAGVILNLFPLLAPLAYLFAGCVGYSRVYNRLHYPADTLAGALLGSWCAALACGLTRTLLGGSL